MALDKPTSNKLARFATAFREARERGANEAETVMCLTRFIEEVWGYDSLKGEISKEVAINDRYCDLALKIDGAVRIVIEAKAANLKALADRHIAQAGNYGANAGVPWVLLTSGIEWRLFHLTFNQGEGIIHDLVFSANFLEEQEKDAEGLWGKLGLLQRDAVKKGSLEDFWAQKKVLSPASVVRVLFHEDVLKLVRRALRKEGDAMLDIEDVFRAVRDLLSKEALAEAGDLGIVRRRKRRKKVQKTDAVTGKAVVEEVDDEEVVAVAHVPPVQAAAPPPALKQ